MVCSSKHPVGQSDMGRNMRVQLQAAVKETNRELEVGRVIGGEADDVALTIYI